METVDVIEEEEEEANGACDELEAEEADVDAAVGGAAEF